MAKTMYRSKLFRYYKDGGVVNIKGLLNKNTASKLPNGKLVIPDEIDGLKVTGLMVSAFSEEPIDEVVIGKNVKVIGYDAFEKCGISKLTFAERPTGFDSDYALEICEFSFSDNSLKSLELPDGIRIELNHSCFVNNKLKGELKIPNGVQRIGAFAFSNNKIKSVVLQDGLLSDFGVGAFMDNYIDKAIIPNSVNIIHPNTFDNSCVLICSNKLEMEQHINGGVQETPPPMIKVDDVEKITTELLDNDKGFNILVDRFKKTKEIYNLDDELIKHLGTYINDNF